MDADAARRQVRARLALAPANWHRGLATEAASALLRYAQGELQLGEIWPGADVPSAA